jgi:hypothetical protein
MIPLYGGGTLADVVPSLLAALGVSGVDAPFELGSTDRACLLVIDGLGWTSLRDCADDAPFLASLAAGAEPITAGFPATTATSIASLGTGRPPGEHGIVGYTFATGRGGLVNALGWSAHGQPGHIDLRKQFVPEQAQPMPTMWELASSAGVQVSLVVPHQHRGSGLTRAVLRGGHLRGVHALGDLTSVALAAMCGPGPRLCYAYHADLDLLGHVYGPASEPWRLQLAHVDQLAATIADGLPAGGVLAVTADHGMVAVAEDSRIDFDTTADLQAGVRLLGGEARARHVYAEPGATGDVLATWRELLGDRAWIATRDEAIDAGWFGPRVIEPRIAQRIGDLVVAARADTAVVRSVVEPTLTNMVGQHGSLTAAEQHVPLLVHHSPR